MSNADSTAKLLQGQVAGVTVASSSAKTNKRASTKSIIKGRVVDKNDGSPLPGATVKIAGTNTVSQTDANGEFTLNADKNKASLVINYIGYQTLKISGRNAVY